MTTTSPHEITQLLLAWSNGDQAALDKLAPLVYEELHRLAKSYMERESPGHTLQTTALIHEVWLRLVDGSQVQWKNRTHFYGICARLMRQILVEFARSHQSLKKGGDLNRITLDEAAVISYEREADLVALDDALISLARIDPRKSQVVELRFFGGLSVEETAEVMKVSPDTVLRDWRLAKRWLLRELKR